MKHLFVTGRPSAIALLAALLVPYAAFASHPDILRNYRFISSRSTLEQTGGFAGVDLSYHLFGKFGLVTGYEEGYSCLAIGCPPSPTHLPFAEFVDVRAFALLDHPAAFAGLIPLEDFVDLERLDGTFRFGDPDHLFFEGEDSQGQRFRLAATLRGPLLHLRGESVEQCCDFFQYRINALAHLAPYADFNLDGSVDRNDIDILLSNIGMEGGATFEHGDADGDGNVDGDDILAWQRQVGTAISLAEFDDAGLGSTSVPEPATVLIIAVAAAFLAALVRPRRSSR